MTRLFIFIVFLTFGVNTPSHGGPNISSDATSTISTTSTSLLPQQSKDKYESMSDIDKILYTSSATVITGLIVFVLGQIITKFVIEPIQDLKKTIGEISYSLSFHARAIITPLTKEDLSYQAQNDLRRLSCALYLKVEAIPCYGFFARICCVRPKEKVLTAATHLMGLSNSVHKPDRSKNMAITDAIRNLLNLEPER